MDTVSFGRRLACAFDCNEQHVLESGRTGGKGDFIFLNLKIQNVSASNWNVALPFKKENFRAVCQKDVNWLEEATLDLPKWVLGLDPVFHAIEQERSDVCLSASPEKRPVWEQRYLPVGANNLVNYSIEYSYLLYSIWMLRGTCQEWWFAFLLY